MWKRDVALVVLILLLAATSAGCAQLTNIVNGRDPATTPIPWPPATPTAAVTPGPAFAPTPTPTLIPTPTSTLTPTPGPTPAPVNDSTPTPSPSPTPTPTPTPTPVPDAAGVYTQVTSGLNVLQPIGIWDHFIVYDEKPGSDPFYYVHLYDIVTGEDRTIATGNVRSYGCIGGEANDGKVALIFGDFYRIMLYDINSRALEPVTSGSSQPYMFPSINGREFLFVQNDDPQNTAFQNIYNYDTIAKYPPQVLLPAPAPNDLRDGGDDIVWWFPSGNVRKVALINKAGDGGLSFISPADLTCDHPRVSGNTVVYHCSANGASYINVYDVDTGATARLTNTGSQSSCDIYGSRIVYDDNRNGNWDIYITDRSTGQETRLTYESHDQTSPVIWGNYVACFDNRDGTPEIFVLTTGA